MSEQILIEGIRNQMNAAPQNTQARLGVYCTILENNIGVLVNSAFLHQNLWGVNNALR